MKTATFILGLVSAAFSMPALREESSSLMVISDPTDCIKEHCANEWNACLNDTKCVPALQSCEDQCGSKVSCWQFCLAKKGNSNAVSVAKCASANHCLGDASKHMSTALAIRDDPIIECVKEKCPDEYQKCVSDSKCLPAIQDCQKKCGTKQTCWEFCLAGKGDTNATNVAKCAAAKHCI